MSPNLPPAQGSLEGVDSMAFHFRSPSRTNERERQRRPPKTEDEYEGRPAAAAAAPPPPSTGYRSCDSFARVRRSHRGLGGNKENTVSANSKSLSRLRLSSCRVLRVERGWKCCYTRILRCGQCNVAVKQTDYFRT